MLTKQGLILFLATLLIAMPLANAVPELDSLGAPRLEARYIVGFHDAVPRELQPGTEYNGAEVLWRDDDLLFVVVLSKSPLVFEATVKRDDRVRYVEWDDPDYATLSLTPNDPRWTDAGMWGAKKIRADVAWDTTLGSTAVKVGMLDSGLNRNHEEYAGQARVLQGYDFVNNDNDPDDSSSCSWHGTHTTGTAGATTNNGKGIAGISQHTILPVKAFYPSFFGCSGSTTAIVNGLKYIADQGSHLSSNSWGGGTSTAINDAIVYAHNKGTVHVAAAGNSGPCTNCVSEPWKTNKDIVIVVASTKEDDGQSSFSSEGAEVDVSAPGSNILSTTSGTTGYGSLSGTSMATPHVTGALALVKARNSGWGFTQLHDCITTTADDLGAAGKDVKFGHGRIRADRAVLCGGGGPAPTVPGAPSLTATGGQNQVSLSWTTPSDGGSAITGYKVYRGTTAGGSKSLLATLGVTNSHTDTAVTAGTTYYYQVSAVNSVGEGARSNEASATPTGGDTLFYAMNFDSGASGWTKSGSGDLWHLGTKCLGAKSPSTSLQYNRGDSNCSYDTGSRNTGWAKSPNLDLRGTSKATLKFQHAWETESYSGGAYDIMRVEVSSNGGTSWTTLQQWDSRNANQLSFGQASYDVSSFAGTSGFTVRYWYDSVDGLSNAYRGWHVDDFEVWT